MEDVNSASAHSVQSVQLIGKRLKFDRVVNGICMQIWWKVLIYVYVREASRPDKRTLMDIIDRDVNVANDVKIIGVKIDGVHTDIIVNEYRNCICVNVAQFGKLGSFIFVSKEGAKPVNGSDVYTVRTLLGRDNVAYQTAARFLHEQTFMTKPAIFSIDLKDTSVRTLKALKLIILQHKMW